MSIRVVPYKHYDPEVKLHLAQLMLRGEQSPSALSRQYQVCRTLLYQWRDRYQEQGSQAFLRRRTQTPPLRR